MSADRNPIEHVRDILGRSVAARRPAPMIIDKLKSALVQMRVRNSRMRRRYRNLESNRCRRISGFQMLNDDEIVTSVQAESDPVDDETDEDEDNNNKSSKGPSNTGVFSALEKAMEWYEQLSQCCPTQLLLSRKSQTLQRKISVNFLNKAFGVRLSEQSRIRTVYGTK
ncbi:hypothetical protein TNCV_316161 [Trichonephila clavipes]|nr:hypothetical protein TNCV_316161 [Trichonephila clavipes]